MVIASTPSTDFRIGTDRFEDLEIHPSGSEGFHYFYDKRRRSLIKRFLLGESPQRKTFCEVTLIQKGDRFTPRLTFSRRTPEDQIVKEAAPGGGSGIKGRVDVSDYHENFWKLINWIGTCANVDVPGEPFSLVKASDAALIEALRGRDPESKAAVVKAVAGEVSFSQKEINQMLNRKGKLEEFRKGLTAYADDEGWWQKFLNDNKWIFGYGLNYQILNIEQAQPSYGGTRADGRGGQRGDYLSATQGALSFTRLVEIKTPATALIQGKSEIRNGAWSLGKDLLDGLAQLQANCDTWEKDGSRTDDNRDRFDNAGIHTVEPKGILVVGSLGQIKDPRSKYQTFERFREGLHGVEILTFDELYERAKFIVGQDESAED